VKLPDIATLSIVVGADRPWRLLASGSWYNWSVFEDIRIVPETGAARVSSRTIRTRGAPAWVSSMMFGRD
jgi:long-chain fatty acid transport protein